MNAYVVYGQDNESYAFREHPSLTPHQEIHQSVVPDLSGTPRAGVHRCETCDELLAKWEESLNGLVIKKKSYDVSSTYDGITIVSDAFKEVYERNRFTGLVFQPLPDSPSFYGVQATRTVQYDAGRRGTRFLDQCSSCGRYESIVGATPVYLKPGMVIGDLEFVRTDVEFGSSDGKSPLLLCGKSAGDVLQSESMKGIELLEVEPLVTGS